MTNDDTLRTALTKLKTAMLGTTDGDLIDPDSEIPAGEMYRLAAEALPSILADALLAAHPAPEAGFVTIKDVVPEQLRHQVDTVWQYDGLPAYADDDERTVPSIKSGPAHMEIRAGADHARNMAVHYLALAQWIDENGDKS